jgi:hypothetical protein
MQNGHLSKKRIRLGLRQLTKNVIKPGLIKNGHLSKKLIRSGLIRLGLIRCTKMLLGN